MFSEQRVGNDGDYPDLDALVMAEIESMREVPARSRRPRAAAVANIAGTEAHREPPSGEESEALFDAPSDERDGVASPDDEAGGTLLSAEEEAFITRALGFLAHRDTADMILGRIWQELAEANPDGYFRPDSAAPGAFRQQAPPRPRAGSTWMRSDCDV